VRLFADCGIPWKFGNSRSADIAGKEAANISTKKNEMSHAQVSDLRIDLNILARQG